jgi:hypothetical protein
MRGARPSAQAAGAVTMWKLSATCGRNSRPSPTPMRLSSNTPVVASRRLSDTTNVQPGGGPAAVRVGGGQGDHTGVQSLGMPYEAVWAHVDAARGGGKSGVSAALTAQHRSGARIMVRLLWRGGRSGLKSPDSGAYALAEPADVRSPQHQVA